jgi:hypothetical protein
MLLIVLGSCRYPKPPIFPPSPAEICPYPTAEICDMGTPVPPLYFGCDYPISANCANDAKNWHQSYLATVKGELCVQERVTINNFHKKISSCVLGSEAYNQCFNDAKCEAVGILDSLKDDWTHAVDVAGQAYLLKMSECCVDGESLQ